jgi:DNA helicase MCM8
LLFVYVRLKGPILSRFDLVFILIDRADDELDFRLSEHVLAQHNRSVRSSNNNTTVNSTRTQHEAAPSNHQQTSSTRTNNTPLIEQLRIIPGETIEPVGPSLLQKVKIFLIYIKYYLFL